MNQHRRRPPRMSAPLLLFALCLILCFSRVSLSFAGSPVAGARGSSSAGAWRWTYLDSAPFGPDEPPFTFKLGVADREPRDVAGERYVPAVRYAHTAVAVGNTMIITHGYHYDLSRGSAGAIWLSDTWEFTFHTHRWRRLHDHVRHPAEGPVARYTAIGVVLGGDLYLHGGDDGGHSAGHASYRHAVYGDLWRFVLAPHANLRRYTWVRVRTVVSRTLIGSASHLPTMLSPGLPLDDLYRCQHGGALAPLGSKHAIWQADAKIESRHSDADGPLSPSEPAAYLFVSHGLYAAERNASANGAAADDDPDDPLAQAYDVLDSDALFVFSFRTKEWRQVRTSSPPPPRFGHSLVYVPDSRAPSDQPSGALYLYGGFSRSAGNRGDLWMIPLQARGSIAAFTWVELHAAYPDGAGTSPGNRAHYALFWTPDARLHLFGGARCEPGCVCSAEYWVYDIAPTSSSGSASDTTSGFWRLLASSPHSPSSLAYPRRDPSGYPEYGPLAHADESVALGYPVHRYKHTMVLAASSPSHGGGDAWSAYLFGGESYNPAAYFQDVWRFEYTPPSPSGVSSSARRFMRALDRQLHENRLAAYERPLPPERVLEPTPFYQYDPPGGWPVYEPREERVFAWPDGASYPSVFARLVGSLELPAADDDLFWTALLGTMVVLLTLLAIVALCCCNASDADEKKRW